MALAYFITFSTYGTWLHGTDKGNGSVDRHHNVFGTPFIAPDDQREERAADRMTDPPYVLNEPARTVVRDAVVELCTEKGWTLLALHVRTNHVHVVVSAEREAGRLMSDLKARASRELNRSGTDANAKRWTRHGSTRHLFDGASVAAAVVYVLDEQGPPMAVYDPRQGSQRAAHEVSASPSTKNRLTSCAAPSQAITDHFAEAGKMVDRVSGHRVSDHSVDVNKMLPKEPRTK
jgi:hypothetical protein